MPNCAGAMPPPAPPPAAGGAQRAARIRRVGGVGCRRSAGVRLLGRRAHPLATGAARLSPGDAGAIAPAAPGRHRMVVAAAAAQLHNDRVGWVRAPRRLIVGASAARADARREGPGDRRDRDAREGRRPAAAAVTVAPRPPPATPVTRTRQPRLNVRV